MRSIGKAAFLSLALTASSAWAARAEELKLGAIGSLSGGGTAWGLALQRGVQLAVEEVNAAGGLKVGGKTYTLRMVMLDDQYTAAGGHTAAQRLVELEKVKFIIGPIGSPPVLGTIGVTAPAKVLVISDGFSPAILKNDDKAAFNFRGMDSNIEFAPAMIDWLKKRHPDLKKVAIIVPNDATGQATVPTLSALYKAAGFEVVAEMFDRGAQEFTPLLTRVMSQGIDLLDLNSNSPTDAGLLMKQARQAGYKGRVWQVGGPSVQETMQVAGSLAEGFISFDVADFTSEAGKTYAAAYHAKWPGIINSESPIWNNAAKLVMEAIRRADSIDVVKVRDALEKLEGYDVGGMYGPTIWGGKGDYGVDHQLLHPFWIVEVKDGKEVPLEKITPPKR